MHFEGVPHTNSDSVSPVKPPSGVDYIQSDIELRKLFRSVKGERLLAMDTEAASFHRFQDRVYLLQLSSRDSTAIVDPLTVTDLTPIGNALSDPKTEVVFHDADYDLRLLDQDFGFHARSIFDTRVAAQLLNEPGIGLAALLDKYLGVKLNKKFQRADWSARPLSAEMLSYAATDTRYLPELRDILRGKLQEKGRLDWAEEEFRLLEQVRWSPAKKDGTEFLRIKGAKALPGRTLAILRELYQWRDTTARRRDKAPFRILNNQAMLHLALTPPRDLAALGRTSGVGPETARRNGKSILAAIERGRLVKDGDLPRVKRPSRPRHDKEYDARLDRLKAARNAVARRLDLQSGVACPNGTLEAIAREAPATQDDLTTVPALRRWQAKEFGNELLAAVASGKQKTETGNQ